MGLAHKFSTWSTRYRPDQAAHTWHQSPQILAVYVSSSAKTQPPGGEVGWGLYISSVRCGLYPFGIVNQEAVVMGPVLWNDRSPSWPKPGHGLGTLLVWQKMSWSNLAHTTKGLVERVDWNWAKLGHLYLWAYAYSVSHVPLYLLGSISWAHVYHSPSSL